MLPNDSSITPGEIEACECIFCSKFPVSPKKNSNQIEKVIIVKQCLRLVSEMFLKRLCFSRGRVFLAHVIKHFCGKLIFWRGSFSKDVQPCIYELYGWVKKGL